MQEKTITLKGVINEKSYKKFKDSIEWVKRENAKTIFIHILCAGGDISFAAQIAKLIQSLESNIDVIFVAHYAHSAALIVFTSRGFRTAKKNAKFLFHNPSAGEGCLITEDEMEKTKKTVVTYLSTALRLEEKKIAILMNNNDYISSEYAKKIGLVHEIIPDAL